MRLTRQSFLAALGAAPAVGVRAQGRFGRNDQARSGQHRLELGDADRDGLREYQGRHTVSAPIVREAFEWAVGKS